MQALYQAAGGRALRWKVFRRCPRPCAKTKASAVVASLLDVLLYDARSPIGRMSA